VGCRCWCRCRRRRRVSASDVAWRARGTRFTERPNDQTQPCPCFLIASLCKSEIYVCMKGMNPSEYTNTTPPYLPTHPLFSLPPCVVPYCVYVSMYKDDVILIRTRSHSVPPGTRHLCRDSAPTQHPIPPCLRLFPVLPVLVSRERCRMETYLPVLPDVFRSHTSIPLSLQSPLFLRDFRRQAGGTEPEVPCLNKDPSRAEPASPAFRAELRSLTFP
jgi:hypothetical protein